MASVNKVIIVGNLGRDPEQRFMPNGDCACNIAVATTESWKDKNSGEKKEITEWHRITLFRKLGEIAGQYLKKGSQVYIEGRLQTRKWTDKEGVERFTTEIIADSMQMLGSRQGQANDSDAPDNYADGAAANKQAGKRQEDAPYRNEKGGRAYSTPDNFTSDDIPF